jgi:hypothetical protein
MRSLLKGAGALACLLVLSSPNAAAAGFSSPAALPPSNDEDWSFAVNERGVGGAVTGTQTGASFYPLSADGQLGEPVALSAPGGFPVVAHSLAVNDQGEVALALVYMDDTVPFSEVEHSGRGCCRRVAVASWQLGRQPPPLQDLSPRQSGNGNPLQVFSAPSLLLGNSTLTALWTREDENEFEPDRIKTRLIEAYGRFSEPLHTKQIASAPRGIPLRQLSLALDGTPTASWLEDRDKLIGVEGHADGSLSGTRRIRRVAHLSVAKGFATETGDPERTLFSYFTDLPGRGERARLNTIERQPGRPFGPARTVATIAGATSASFAASPGGVLAMWEKDFSFSGDDHLYVKPRTLSAQRPRTESLGLGQNATGFIDSRGRAVVIYIRPRTRSAPEALLATVAEPGQRFAAPQPLAPGLGHCQLEHQEAFDPPPPAISRDGHAEIVITCETPAGRNEYVVRYTP